MIDMYLLRGLHSRSMQFLMLLTMCFLFTEVKAQVATGADTYKMDVLRSSYQSAKTDTAKMRSLRALTNAYYAVNDFKQALLYNGYIHKLAYKLMHERDTAFVRVGMYSEAFFYNCLADVLAKQGDYRQAFNSYAKALEIYQALRDRKNIAIIFSNIANNYSAIGNYNESLVYSFKALKLQEELGDEARIGVEFNNIGAIYSDIKNFSKALEYYIKARDISKKQNDTSSIALYNGNIGHCYQLLCDSAYEAGNTALSIALQNKALNYYFEALNMSEEIQDFDNMAVCLENIGIVYSNVNDYKHALPYLIKALNLYNKLGLNGEESYCLIMVGTAYQGMGQINKAEKCFKQSLDMALRTRSNHYLKEAYLGNSEFYEKLNRPDKAFMYYRQYIHYRDSIFNRENNDEIVRTELNYTFEKKQAAVKFENDKVIYRLESDNKLYKQWRLFFIVVIVLILVLLFFGKRAYDNKKKLANLLTAEDQRKEVLLQEVHHRINNNLQIISSLLTLQANNANDAKLTEYLAQSQNRIQSLSAMHELLYDTNSPLDINMKDYISKVLDFHRDIASSMPVRIVIEEDMESVKFPTKLAVPIALIVNELVTNSLKYAFTNKENGHIKISLRKNPEADNWTVIVRDNGSGLPEESQKRKDSLGLKLVNIMTRQIGGIFETKNEDGAYFSLIFNLVKKK